MTISEYLQSVMLAQQLKRGELPAILRYTNPAKCLRRYDNLLANSLSDTEFIKRMKTSPHQIFFVAFAGLQRCKGVKLPEYIQFHPPTVTSHRHFPPSIWKYGAWQDNAK